MNRFQLGWPGAGPGLAATLKLGKEENHTMSRKTGTAKAFLPAVAVVTMATLGLTAAPASAAISIVSQTKGFVDSSKSKLATAHLGTTLLSYDATGVQKLVVAIGTECGFNNQNVNVTGLTFNGVALTQAVEERTYLGDRDGGTAEIWYLDSPFQGSANFGFTYTSTGGGINGGYASIIGLSGAAGGIGAASAAFTNVGPVTTSITTTANDSLVIAMVENSGTPNASGTPTVQAPLTLINNGLWGSNWGGVASGYQFVPGVGTTITPTFTTNTGDKYSIHTVAVEFTPPVPTQYWDVNGTSVGAGGPAATGTWDAATTNWSPKADGTDPVAAWSPGYTAVFAAGTDATDSYTVIVDGPRDVGGLTFEEGTVTLANGASGALRLTGTTPANVASGRTATIAIPVGEDAAGRELAKVGPGTLVLSGDLSYTGATTVAQGTAVLSGNNVAATGVMTLNGGLTQFDSPASINGTARDVTVNPGGTVVFGPSFGAGNIPAALLNRIVDSSAGVVAADNYDSTAFDFNTPGLTAAYLGAVGNVTYTGTLTPNGTTYRLGGGGGTLTMANANAVTGTGNSLIVKGNVVLSAANNYDSGTTLAAGTLAVGDDGSLGSGALTINGGAIQSADGGARLLANALVIGSNVTVGGTGDMTFSDGSATALGATRTFTINNGASTFAQAFSGTGFGITKLGTGTLVLTGNSTYTGLTTVSAGALTLGGDNTAATGGVTLNGATAMLKVNSATALGTGTLTLTAGTIDNTSGSAVTVTTSNAVTIGGNFTFGGSSDLTLGGGPVTNGGSRTITLNGVNSTLAFGGVMTNTQNNVQTTTVNGAGNTLVLGGYALSNNATSRIDVITGTGNVTITGAVTNGGTATASGLTKQGMGVLTLSDANTYAGATTISGGALQIGNAGTTGSLSPASAIVNNATLKFNRTDTLTQGTDFNSVISGSGAVIQVGSGVTILNGTNTYNGATTVDAGRLQAVTAAALPNYAGGTISVNAGMLAVNAGGATEWAATEIDGLLANPLLTFATGTNLGIDTSSGNFSYVPAANLTGANMGLTKLGANKLALSGTNSYGGGTTVTEGTLQIDSAGALPAGYALTIGAGGTVVLSSGLGAAGVASAGGAAAVPEPGTIGLLAAALAGLLIAAWRRRR